jgi:hypothetical protein
MQMNYLTKYQDKFGLETTTILNNGKKLKMTLRGIEFEGDDFDSFEPMPGYSTTQLMPFLWQQGKKQIEGLTVDTQWLSRYRLECEMPMPVGVEHSIVQGALLVHLQMAGFQDNKSKLWLELIYENELIRSKGEGGGFFDVELMDIQNALPPNVYLKACFRCIFSDFGPYQGMFGSLGCYRGNKEAYFRLKNNRTPGAKWELLKIMTEPVQEIWLCSEFERE